MAVNFPHTDQYPAEDCKPGRSCLPGDVYTGPL